MEQYPLLYKRRSCIQYIFGSKLRPQPCTEFPCVHMHCHDPDFLADVEDAIKDRKFHIELWNCFHHPESNKARLSTEKWAEYELKFERCRRLIEKRTFIDASIDLYHERRRREIMEFHEQCNRSRLAKMKNIIKKGQQEWENNRAGQNAGSYVEWVMRNKNATPERLHELGITKKELYLVKSYMQMPESRRIQLMSEDAN